MSCDHEVDPTFYRVFMNQQRLRERDQEYKERREEEFRGRSIEQISELLRSQGEFPSDSPASVDTPVKVPGCTTGTPLVTLEEEKEGEEVTKKKRKLFHGEVLDEEVSSSDLLPLQYRHLRHSERKVRDDFYTTCATLAGEGMSLLECTTAVVTFGNGNWKKVDEKEDSFDIDTAPGNIKLLEKLRQIEAESLSLMVDEMRKGKEQGRLVTHANNSTTKPRVGQFIGQVVLHYHHHHNYYQHHINHNYPTHKHNDYNQGIHSGQASVLPLPLLPICGESREDIAAHLGMGLEILSAVSGVAVA